MRVNESIAWAALQNSAEEALIEIWHRVRADLTWFDKVSSATGLDLKPHEQVIDRLSDLLCDVEIDSANFLPRIAEFEIASELILLSAIDRALQRSPIVTGYECFSPRQFARDGKQYSLQRRYRAYDATYARQDKIHVWLRYHWVTESPGDSGEVPWRQLGDQAEFTTRERLKRMASSRVIRIRRIEPVDGVKLEGVMEAVFFLPDLSDPELRWQTILQELMAATQESADIVVLPELSMTKPLQERLANWLTITEHPFALIVAGSCHCVISGGNANRAQLLGVNGETLIEHRKLTRFAHKIDNDRTSLEDIQRGTELQILTTPIGTVAIPICLDLCGEDNVLKLPKHSLALEWILSPTMGNEQTISAQLARAKEFHRQHGSVTTVANISPIGDPVGGFHFFQKRFNDMLIQISF